MADNWQWDILPDDNPGLLRRVLLETDLVATSLECIYGLSLKGARPAVSKVEYVGDGGAMRVYRVWVPGGGSEDRSFALKLVKSSRLAAIFPRSLRSQEALSEEERVEDLIAWMLQITERVNAAAPGIYPVFGGYWRLADAGGPMIRFLTEQFIAGPTLMERRLELEELMASGHLDYRGYTTRRTALDRVTIGTFVRLWNALDRSAFTSDPSPWNIKVTGNGSGARAIILDLHLLAEPAPLIFLVERFQALYGLRDEVVRGAILPGIADALGQEEAAAILHELRPQLDALSASSRQRVGTDLYASFRRAVDDWLAV